MMLEKNEECIMLYTFKRKEEFIKTIKDIYCKHILKDTKVLIELFSTL